MTYSLPVWFPMIDKNGTNRINAIYSKYLKRCLGVPKSTSNAKVLFITGSEPTCNYLHELSQRMFFKISYPSSLSGIQFAPPNPNLFNPYSAIREVPSYFWLSEQLRGSIPNNPASRRALMYEIFDLFHHHVCRDAETHHSPMEDCRCKLCGGSVQRYHFRECRILSDLSPCAKLRLLKI